MAPALGPFADRSTPMALAGVEGGQGEPLLLLSHPPFPAAEVFGACLAAWARDHRILALDFPGTGGCAALTGRLDRMSFSVAVADLLRRRRLRPRAVLAAGLSSSVGLDLAMSTAGTVERLVLLDPFLSGFHVRLPPAERRLLGSLGGLRARLGPAGSAALLAEGVLPTAAARATFADERRRKSYRAVLAALAPPRTADRLRADVLQQCHVRAACLLVCGTKSPNSGAGPLAMVLRRFTDARVLAVEGAGRFPAVERPEQVTAAVESFLAGQWPVEPGLPLALR
jgi:pimeloyl-ACP methyl ester carboxylesterase